MVICAHDVRLVISRFAAAPECSSYNELNDATRLDSFSGGQATCDQWDGFQNGWYRFVGASGTQIATSAPPKNRCRTHATGWMQGQHPTVDEGAVTRKVCYHWGSNTCNWSNDIKVRQCPGGFFVYELVKPPVCHLRYCTASSSVAPGRETYVVFLEAGAICIHQLLTRQYAVMNLSGMLDCNQIGVILT